MKKNESISYIKTQTQIVTYLVTIEGIRISELLPLKVSQLDNNQAIKEGLCKS